MSKDESETLKIGGIKIPQWLVTIIASLVTSLIVGYFTLQASLQPVQLQISATQTAESRLLSTPVVGITATQYYQQGTPTQQTFFTETPVPSNSIPESHPFSSLGETTNIDYIQKYYFLFALWVFVAIANSNQRNLLFKRLAYTMSKPAIFKKDYTYPTITTLKEYLIKKFQSNPSAFWENIFSLILFLCFTPGVVIETVHSINPMFYSNKISFSLIILMLVLGCTVAPAVGFWKIASKNLLDKDPLWKKIITICSSLLFLSGILIAIIMSLYRWSIQTMLPQPYETWMNQASTIIVSIFIPINYLLVSIVVMIDAFAGLPIAMASIVLLLFYLGIGLALGAIFIINVLARVSILYIHITSYLLITPIDTVVAGVKTLLNKNAT